MNELIDELLATYTKIVNNFVIKDMHTAIKSGNYIDDALYEAAILPVDVKNFFTFERFYSTIFEQLRMDIGPSVTYEQLYDWVTNPSNTPLKYRKLFMTRAIELIKQFQETNNYYRIYLGLPPTWTRTENFIYPDPNFLIKLGLPDDTPLHDLSTIDQDYWKLLYSVEYAELLKIHEGDSDYLYLKYIGSDKEDRSTMHLAADNIILSLSLSDINVKNKLQYAAILLDEFKYQYNLLMSSVSYQTLKYLKDESGVNYDFPNILTSAIQNVFSRVDQLILERKLLSISICDDYLTEFKIDKYKILDSYKPELVKYLAIILRQKANNLCLTDIASKFGAPNSVVNKYVFHKWKNEVNEIDLEFIKLPLNTSTNIPASNTYNKYTFEEITDADSLWSISKDDTIPLVYFNISPSPYISITEVTASMKTINDIYIPSIIFAAKDILDAKTVTLAQYTGSELHTLFNIYIFKIVLSLEYYERYGPILRPDIHNVSKIYGWDPNDRQKVLTKIKNFYGEESTLYNLYANIALNSIYDIEDVSKKINLLLVECFKLFYQCNVILDQEKLQDTYWAIFTCQPFDLLESPEYKDRWKEWLEIRDPSLYELLSHLDEDGFYENLLQSILQILDVNLGLNFSSNSKEYTNVLLQQLETLVLRFKSKNVRLLGSEVEEGVSNLLVDDLHTLKLFDSLWANFDGGGGTGTNLHDKPMITYDALVESKSTGYLKDYDEVRYHVYDGIVDTYNNVVWF